MAREDNDGPHESSEEGGEGEPEQEEQEELGGEEEAASAKAAAEAHRAELVAQIRRAKQEAGIAGGTGCCRALQLETMLILQPPCL
jgi:hypothetical protein